MKRKNNIHAEGTQTGEIERYCRFCQHASGLSDEDHMLCGIRGIVSCGFVCRKFIYDPLKREPKRLSREVRLEYIEI